MLLLGLGQTEENVARLYGRAHYNRDCNGLSDALLFRVPFMFRPVKIASLQFKYMSSGYTRLLGI